MSFFLSPIGNDQAIDANGDPLNGGQIETYLAGSSTPAATFTSSSGAVTQANPVILNALGATASPIWLTGGVAYKFILKDANSVTLRTIDNIQGINDTNISVSEWVDSGLVPTYLSAVSFSVPGDQTGTLQIGRRLKTQNTSGLIYSSIANSVFASSVTTVTTVNDSGTLDSGLSAVQYGLISSINTSVPTQMPRGGIVIWSGSVASIPSGWYLCDGTNSTPNLQDKFIIGAGSTYAVAATGGSADAVVVSHTHGVTDPGHAHGLDGETIQGSVSSGPSALTDGTARPLGSVTDAATTGVTVNSAGVSGTNANLPPYYALAFIMRG